MEKLKEVHGEEELSSEREDFRTWIVIMRAELEKSLEALTAATDQAEENSSQVILGPRWFVDHESVGLSDFSPVVLDVTS